MPHRDLAHASLPSLPARFSVWMAALAAFLVATVAPSARGEVVVNAIETGGDVVIFGEGSLNLGRGHLPPKSTAILGESARLPATSWSGPLRVPQACFVTPTR